MVFFLVHAADAFSLCCCSHAASSFICCACCGAASGISNCVVLLLVDGAGRCVAGIEDVAANGRPYPERLAAAVVSHENFISALSQRGVEPQEAEALLNDLMQQPGGIDNSSNRGVCYFQWAHRVTPATAGHEGPLRCLSKVRPSLSTLLSFSLAVSSSLCLSLACCYVSI